MINPLVRILCADDEPDMRMLIGLSLENVGGFTVSVCASGRELLDKIDDFQPDLILLDAMMPGIDGLQTLKEIRSHDKFATIPVVFMTGKTDQAGIEELRAAGAAEVIRKPFDPVHLPEDIKALWKGI